jgi:tRNA pseudouridine38-40 synthase
VNPRTLKLTITYDGTRLIGWQRQAEGTSVQGLLEEALARLEGHPVIVHGAGRTDAGVHAFGQVASTQLTCPHPPEILRRALNATLPLDVRVVDVSDAEPDFHARFSARAKTYRYVLLNAAIVSPFEHRYVWHVPEPLDLGAMQTAAQALIGTHDFAAFRSTGSTSTTTVRTIVRSEMSSRTGFPSIVPFVDTDGVQADGDDLKWKVYEVTGNGFLRHMVRAIVGTLVDIGRGRYPPGRMAELLEDGSRSDAGATAPAQGLFLVRVDYH